MSDARLSIIPAAAVCDDRLTPRSLQVLALLGTYTDKQGWCFPRQNLLAERLDCSRSTINRALSLLVDLGYVQQKHRYGPDGSQQSSLYRVLLDGAGVSKMHTPVHPECTGGVHPECTHNVPTVNDPTNNDNTADANASPVKADEADLKKAVGGWNEMAQRLGLPLVRKLTAARKSRLKKRLADGEGLAGWQAALAKVEASAFCRGEKTDWKADFDFLLQERSFVKLLEGAYDDNGAAAHTPTGGQVSAAAQIYLQNRGRT